MLPGGECWVPVVSTAPMTMACFFHEPARTHPHPDRNLPPSDSRGSHMHAPSVAILAPARLCPRLEAGPAGRAGDKDDSVCRRVDRPSSRHIQDRNSSTGTQEDSGNEQPQGLANLPAAAVAVD
ncbi:hypothetical protein SprV_0100169900 [Sparganum proliferum]